MSPTPKVVVLDHTALLALGTGSKLLSELVTQAHATDRVNVYLPALCLSAAVALRPALADHVGLLPALEVVELDYVSAVGVGALIADGIGWQAAQAVVAGRATPEWPAGRPVLTTVPERYAGRGVQVLPIG